MDTLLSRRPVSCPGLLGQPFERVAIRAGEVIKVMDLDAFRSNEGMSLAEWMTNVYAAHTPKMRRVSRNSDASESSPRSGKPKKPLNA